MKKFAYVTFRRGTEFVGSFPLTGSYTMPPEVVGCTVSLEYKEVEMCECGEPEHAGPCA